MSPVHVRAEPGEFAESVLLPGDPLRAKYIAENFFEDAKFVTGERGMLGYTGTYEGKPVSVQTTGMGCPSASIVTETRSRFDIKAPLTVQAGHYSCMNAGSSRASMKNWTYRPKSAMWGASISNAARPWLL